MERVTRAIALIMLAALGLAGCADRPSAREQALETATASADKVSSVGGESRFPWTLEQLGRKATAVNGVAVVKAEGTTTSAEPRFATAAPGSRREPWTKRREQFTASWRDRATVRSRSGHPRPYSCNRAS